MVIIVASNPSILSYRIVSVVELDVRFHLHAVAVYLCFRIDVSNEGYGEGATRADEWEKNERIILIVVAFLRPFILLTMHSSSQ